MDFAIPEELQALRASFRSFLDREIRPLEEGLLAEFWSGTPDHGRRYEAAQEAKRRSVAQGFYAPYMPEAMCSRIIGVPQWYMKMPG